jgi:type IV pilus assembly protein PilM
VAAAAVPAAAGVPAGAPGAVPAAAGAPSAAPASTAAGVAAASSDPLAVAGPEGPGWVIEIKGYHFFNEDITTWGGTHVRDTFLKNLREQTVELPSGPGQAPTRFTMKELGVDFAVLTVDPPIDQTNQIPNPFFEGGPAGQAGYPGAMDGTSGMMPGMTPGMMAPGMMAPAGMGAPGGNRPGAGAKSDKKEKKEEPKEPPFFLAPKYSFVLQFCWQEKLLTERRRQRAQAQLQQQQPDQAAPAAPGGQNPAVPGGQNPAVPGGPPPAAPGNKTPAVPGNKVAAANIGG